MDIKKALLKNKKEILNISFCDNKEKLLDFIASKLDDIKIIHFYIKNLSDKDNLELGFKIQQLCAFYNALFLVNSRADLALILDSDGIFLDKNDIDIHQAKKIIHADNKLFATSYATDDCDYTIINYKQENNTFKIG